MSTENIGTATEGQQTQDSATASGQKTQEAGTEPRTFTQEEVNRLIAKELKPLKEIKAEYEKTKQLIQQQEDAQKSELQKALERVASLEPFEKQAKEYESTLAEILEAEKANIPEENLSLIPEQLSPREQLAYIAKNRFRLIPNVQHAQGQARTSNQSQGTPDKFLQKADTMMSELYPRVPIGTDEWKRKRDRLHEQIKQSQAS